MLYPGVIEALTRLREAGKKTVFLTNTPRRSYVVVRDLNNMGLPSSLYDGVLSSGEVVYHEFKSKKDAFLASLGTNCYYLGPERNESVYEGLEYRIVTDPNKADFILNTGNLFVNDSVDTYIPLFSACVERFLPMVCVNPDKIILNHGQFDICAGTLATKYEAMGGRVCYRGKPDKSVYMYCLEGLQIEDKSKVVMIGDAFETDLAGAEVAGLDSVFVCGGIHAREIGFSKGMPDMQKLEDILRHYGRSPQAILPSLMW
ncbi:MAG: TIGR01459 family HAD-type hydrolase [Alphaproteobacteria bacterium]|nr:TIGR01459 family HAD-type hydrolase [Alphaproteobacteria bacterium]